ncbi:MAG: DUF1214 domain-containing protein [Hyphomicrobiales bacterium]|nr:DUF1214 domain-containing protein [Hyphomicrobiales bacterium]
MTIYIQGERSPEDQVSNWLPAPPEEFIMHMRVYRLKKPILDRTY